MSTPPPLPADLLAAARWDFDRWGYEEACRRTFARCSIACRFYSTQTLLDSHQAYHALTVWALAKAAQAL